MRAVMGMPSIFRVAGPVTWKTYWPEGGSKTPAVHVRGEAGEPGALGEAGGPGEAGEAGGAASRAGGTWPKRSTGQAWPSGDRARTPRVWASASGETA